MTTRFRAPLHGAIPSRELHDLSAAADGIEAACLLRNSHSFHTPAAA